MKTPKQRPYMTALNKWMGMDWNNEYELGNWYLDTQYPWMKYQMERSSVFWNWFRKRNEGMAKFIFLELSIFPNETKLNYLEKEAIETLYSELMYKFLKKPNRLDKEFFRKLNNTQTKPQKHEQVATN